MGSIGVGSCCGLGEIVGSLDISASLEKEECLSEPIFMREVRVGVFLDRLRRCGKTWGE